jgi:hypothetical protein
VVRDGATRDLEEPGLGIEDAVEARGVGFAEDVLEEIVAVGIEADAAADEAAQPLAVVFPEFF